MFFNSLILDEQPPGLAQKSGSIFFEKRTFSRSDRAVSLETSPCMKIISLKTRKGYAKLALFVVSISSGSVITLFVLFVSLMKEQESPTQEPSNEEETVDGLVEEHFGSDSSSGEIKQNSLKLKLCRIRLRITLPPFLGIVPYR